MEIANRKTMALMEIELVLHVPIPSWQWPSW